MSRWIKVNISLITHNAGSMLDYKEYYNNKTDKEIINIFSLNRVERNTLKNIYKAVNKFKDKILPKYKSHHLTKNVVFKINPIFAEEFDFKDNGAFIHRYNSKILVQLYATLRGVDNDNSHIQREIQRLFYQSKIPFIESGVAIISDSYLGTDTLIYNSFKEEIEIYNNKIDGIYRISHMIPNEISFDYDIDGNDETWFELNGIKYKVEEINKNKEYFKKLFDDFGIFYKFIPINY